MLWDYYAQQVDTVYATNLELGGERLSVVHQHLIHCLGICGHRAKVSGIVSPQLTWSICYAELSPKKMKTSVTEVYFVRNVGAQGLILQH